LLRALLIGRLFRRIIPATLLWLQGGLGSLFLNKTAIGL
jgi:hypothetical protein